MLTELRVLDYAVIRELTLEVGPGLTVLTGETGAGKSIVVGALSLLLGGRASAEVVRAGARRARVEGAFQLPPTPALRARLAELGVDAEDGVLILAREVGQEGRSRAWVNGSPSTVGAVAELGRWLVDLHGQHEHQTLLRSDEQRAILDAFAGALPLAAEVQGLHRKVVTLREEMERREARRRELEARADFLRFQWQEIHGAHLEPGEDVELAAELRRLEHAEELLTGARQIAEGLYGGDEAVSDALSPLRERLRELARVDETLAGDSEALEEAYQAVVEVGRRMERYTSSVELDPGRLEELRSRLDLLYRLKRKYGPALEEVIATGVRLRGELDEIEEVEGGRSTLEQRRAEAEEGLVAAAARLTALRTHGAERLGPEVVAALQGLGMQGATFEVALEALPEVGSGGAERIEFLAALNRGFEPRPLSRIASGGELSRVMLALKSILARVDEVPTLIFDEIDAGVGGSVAVALAARLREVAEHHQVLVITHLAQVAARAHRHFTVEKGDEAGVTTTALRVLEGEARVLEVARLLGGDPESRTSREHARELLGRTEGPDPA
jgi:DNA repair protein RecN (Recombination protein N)